MSWLTRARKGINIFKHQEGAAAPQKREIPENLWSKCPSCGDLCYHKELAGNLWVCFQCGYHYPVDAMRYFELILDEGSFEEVDALVDEAERAAHIGQRFSVAY